MRVQSVVPPLSQADILYSVVYCFKGHCWVLKLKTVVFKYPIPATMLGQSRCMIYTYYRWTLVCKSNLARPRPSSQGSKMWHMCWGVSHDVVQRRE